MANSVKTAIKLFEGAQTDVGAEQRRLNKNVDDAMAATREHEAAPRYSETEFASAVREQARRGAERFAGAFQNHLLNRELSLLDLMPVHARDNRGRPIGGPPNYDVLIDGFHFLLNANPAAMAAVIELAPRGGSSNQEWNKTLAELKAKHAKAEVALFEFYEETEAAGFKPTRRPDLSPRVILGFADQDNWNKQSLEAQRQRCAELVGAQTNLSRKRAESVQTRMKLEHLVGDTRDPKLTAEIDQLKRDEETLNERILANEKQISLNGKIFNRLVQFLRSEGVIVDVRL